MLVTAGADRARLRRPPTCASRCSPRRTSPAGPARRRGTCAGCRRGGATRRPAAAAARRLRGARAARRRPVRRADRSAPSAGGRDPRVPGHRVRAVQARPAGRPAWVPDRPARPGHPLRRRRVAEPEPDGRLRLGQDQGPGAQGGQGDRRRADPALLRPDGDRRATRSARTPRGSASSRTPSPYVETPDQLVTIDEVKADMEKPVPMDRLVCGDVGYGKTEIAVRAAFKAVQDGKQVAVLVPTTLLVQQHLDTFTERYAPFPVTVEGAVAVPVRRRGQGGRRRAVRRQRRRGHRHPSADHGAGALQGPRPGGDRRGAAVRRRAQGDAQGAAHGRRRAGDERDADPADPGDGGHRHPRDVHAGDPAGGAAPGAVLRRPVRREAGHRGDPARAAARGPGLLRAQPGRVDRARRRPARRAGARGPDRHRARQDGRAPARAGHRRLLGEEVRRPGQPRPSSRPGWTSPTRTP